MKPFQKEGTSTISLISIVLLYVLLIALILVFSGQMLKDIAEGRTLSNFMIIPLAIVLPIFLLGSIIFNVVRLFKDRARGNPGVRLKIRMILFFSFIALLSSIPQGILSLSFIDTTVQSWFSDKLGSSLEGGVDIALEYHNNQIENLKSLSESNVLTLVLQDVERRPSRVYQNLYSIDRSITGIQVFNEQGNIILMEGDEELGVSYSSIKTAEQGLLSKESTNDMTILRALSTYSGRRGEYSVIISKTLPKDFDKKAEQLTGALAVFKQLDKYQSIFRIVLLIFYFFFSFPLLLLSILVSFILSEEIMRPITNLENATKKVADGDFSIRILSRPHDELAILIRSFNRMVSELEHSRLKTKQTEKVSAWQEIAQRMAHEIKNPLTPIKLSAQRLLRKYEKDSSDFEKTLYSSVASIIREVENLNTLLQEFRDFARLPSPQPDTLNLKVLVQEVAETYASNNPQIRFDFSDIDENIELQADRKQLYQVFSNLFKNSLEALNQEGDIAVRVDLVTKGNLRYCRIQVQDFGTGINPDEYDQVFNPYFTTKQHGTGLGLPIVERIIFDHNGQIWFESEKGIGTTFFIDLPMEVS